MFDENSGSDMLYPTPLELICQNQWGSLFRCKCCDKMQIEFLNVSVSFNPRQYLRVLADISELLLRDIGKEFAKSYSLRFPLSGLAFLYTYEELEALRDLMVNGRDEAEQSVKAASVEIKESSVFVDEVEEENNWVNPENTPDLTHLREGTAMVLPNNEGVRLRFSNATIKQSIPLLIDFRAFLWDLLKFPVTPELSKLPVYEVRFSASMTAWLLTQNEVASLFVLVEHTLDVLMQPARFHFVRNN